MHNVFSVFRPDTLKEGSSKTRLVVIFRPSRRRWHRFIELHNIENVIAAQTPGAQR